MTAINARLQATLQIRPGEGALVAMMTGMMLAAFTGEAVASAGIEALFYARFGVEYLPVMYIILGLVTPLVSLVVTGALARTDRRRFYLILPLVMAALLLGARLAVLANPTWLYALLWLTLNVFWLLQSLFLWGMASLVCDTRQAKRLFPLFGVGGIVGVAVGSFLARFLVGLTGTENLILAWVIGLGVALVLALRLIATQKLYLEGPMARRRQSGILKQIGQEFSSVRGSVLLRWIAFAAVSFAVLYYALVFPFAAAVSEQFGDEEAIAAFLGTFMGLATGAAVLASLFLANRLYARVGFMAIVVAYPVIYLAGFSVMALGAGFAALVIFHFVQMFWSSGFYDGALQATFNVVPADKREQSRTFITGVTNQLGTSLAGVMLLLSQQALETRQIYLIGVVAALLNVYFTWKARRAYGPAVVAALRAGHAQVFYSEERPFGGFQRDAVAVSAAIASIRSQDVTERRIAADILGNLSLPETTQAMVEALDDPDASVRAAILKAFGRSQATPAMLEVAAGLHDDEAEVRLQAVIALRQLAPYPRGLRAELEPLLADRDAAVRSHAAATLLSLGPDPRAESLLQAMTAGEGEVSLSARLGALEALVYWGSEEAYELAATGLKDAAPAVRRTSATIMAQLDGEACLGPLTYALGDEDKIVRKAAATALGKLGPPALDMALGALGNSKMEDGALLALQRLPAHGAGPKVRRFAARQVAKALYYHDLWLECRAWQERDLALSGAITNSDPLATEKWELLAESLSGQARRHGVKALNAMAVLGNTTAVTLAIEDLDNKDAGQRANAMETLDAIGEAGIVRPLLPLWETDGVKKAAAESQAWLMAALSDDDAWIRACAASAAATMANQEVVSRLAEMAQDDSDHLVRECASSSKPEGGSAMESVRTLSTVERVLFLRRVRLFADLPPDDLRQIASVAEEMTFGDGVTLARQGDPGDMLFIIISGEIMVTAANEAGEEVELGRRQPGEYVGEMSIVGNEVRMASLIALGAVRTLCISQKQFREILRLRPEVALAVMAGLSHRLREQLANAPVVAEKQGVL
jgi:HEAT repeat protein